MDSFISMSPCAAKFYIASVNPFHPSASGACIPTRPARPSQKVTAKLAFDIVIGTGGVGFALISPTLANDPTCCFYTTGTYAGTGLTATFGTTGLSYVAMSQLPYTSAQLTDGASAGAIPQVQGRIISCGASITYTGTELNRGGLVRCYADPMHENIAGYTIAQLDQRNETEMKRTDEKTCWVSTAPISATEMEYPDISQAPSANDAIILSSYPFSGGNVVTSNAGDTTRGAPVMAVVAVGQPANTYHVEVVTHAEYMGQLAEGKTSENSADSEGLEKALSALGRLPALKVANPRAPIGKLAKMALIEAGKELGPVALRAGKAMILAALA